MIVLIAVGAMNIAVMAALAVVIGLEKMWRRGELLARVVGVVFLVLAVAVLFFPGLAPGMQAAPMMTGM